MSNLEHLKKAGANLSIQNKPAPKPDPKATHAENQAKYNGWAGNEKKK
jgi:hypothetical protein